MCYTARRKKRQIDDNVVIGGDDNCLPGVPCNGPLEPETTYTFQACGLNEDGRYACALPTPKYTTSALDNPCESSPCQNDGNCTKSQTSETASSFSCSCQPEWAGDICDKPRIKPTVTCTSTSNTDVSVSYHIPAGRGNNSTIISSYIIKILHNGTEEAHRTMTVGGPNTSFTGLSPCKQYTIAVTVILANEADALTEEGTATCKNPKDVFVAPAMFILTDSPYKFTVAMTEILCSESKYIRYQQIECEQCSESKTVQITGNSHVVSGLKADSKYRVTVFGRYTFGDGPSTTQVIQTQSGTPTLLIPNYALPVSGAKTSVTVTVHNLCASKDSIFNQSSGVIVQVVYFVRQHGSTGSIPNSLKTYYNSVKGQDPRPFYRTMTVLCTESSTDDVVIGSAGSCSSDNLECNGPLLPGKTYYFEACAFTRSGKHTCVEPSDRVTTTAG